ncbi:hypothetical protein CFIMG_007778RA00001 [Ceratocystis fimbriata CBS 114723]|uniref:Centrosomin N-terminal motif 1 domain-containing protein n=1 Tax=Ceratocystis fimbriata CBS 114723 TaxID=1035309 RepID=A0A2C5XBC2_9PEZI|nr:hypothetical protein CFIMG_007778RA00001 [Ceratocystis fimbriata CBS 114723]
MDSSPMLPGLERQRLTPHYTRSSTVSSLGRLPTPQSSNGSTHSMSSPQIPTANIAYRLSNTSSAKPVLVHSPRPSPLPREGTVEIRPSAMSTYLQEKLAKERKEGDFTARMTPDPSSPMEARIPGSPARISTPTQDRGAFQAIDNTPGKKGLGMGVKEMEVTVTTLHKQNFDLKLELYHRRERQQALESRLEGIESEKRQMEQMNDRLLEELEKRDKAVEEAVAMIVMLESQVENLLKERETIRKAESRIYENQRWTGDNYETPSRSRTPRQRPSIATDDPQFSDSQTLRSSEDRPLNRMPSFLSDLNETTENLRNVYLTGAKAGSIVNLPSLNEALSEVEAAEASIPEQLRSPSLSMLSESSFVSVYGAEKSGTQSNARSMTTDFGTPNQSFTLDRQHTPRLLGTPRQPDRTLTPRGHRNPSAHSKVASLSSISGPMLDQNSPLQRLEQTYRLRGSSGSSNEQIAASTPVLRSSKAIVQRKGKEDKRASLKEVLTELPNRSIHDSGMPPTPDTISTATLRRYQVENDAVDRSAIMLASSPLDMGNIQYIKHTGSNGSFGGVPLQTKIADDASSERSFQPPTVPDFPGRRDAFDTLFASQTLQRPHSAGASTILHHSDYADSDDEDARSLASSLDIWIREGGKPPRALGCETPDLLSLPYSGAHGWTPKAIFGAANGLMDPKTLFDTPPPGAPPPPHRRSSLNAKTGAGSSPSRPQTMATMAGKDRGGKARRDEVSRPSSQPGVPFTKNSGMSKNSPYPPPAQPQRQRGINNFWRRSLGSSGLVLNSSSATVDQTIGNDGGVSIKTQNEGTALPSETDAYGTGAWHKRHSLAPQDIRNSATPPPIARNRALSIDLRPEVEGCVVTANNNTKPTTPRTPINAQQHVFPPHRHSHGYSASVSAGNTPITPTSGPNGGSKKGWLSRFGRSNSISKSSKDREA